MSTSSASLATHEVYDGAAGTAPPLSWVQVLLLLMSRTLLFIGAQVVVALILTANGEDNAWRESAYWWPVSAITASVVSLFLLYWLQRRDGRALWSLYKPNRRYVAQDILTALGTSAIGGVLVSLPNTWFSQLFFGDTTTANAMMFRPLPLAAALAALVLFPLAVGLSELPTYLGVAMPRLRVLSGKWWVAVLIAGFWLAAQHMALPLIFDGRFLLWRLMMFLPFALYTAGLIAWRPRLLPYFVIIHVLLDITTAYFLLP
jgi:hypothetical protein